MFSSREAALAAGRCGAQLRASRNGGSYCPNRPVLGRERCRMHGGTARRGPDSPAWKGRGHSRDLPTRLADRVEGAMRDPELTSMLHEIAVTTARIDELYGQFDTGEAGSAWRSAAAAAADARLAGADVKKLVSEPVPDGDEVGKALERLTQSLDKFDHAMAAGEHERSLWHEIFEVHKHRGRLVEVELKREERLEQNISARQAVTLLGVVKQVLLKYLVPGTLVAADARVSAAREIAQLVNVPARPALAAPKEEVPA